MLFADLLSLHLVTFLNSTYHEVFEHQIWFPFMKGLVHYNIFCNDKLLIPKSLPRNLNVFYSCKIVIGVGMIALEVLDQALQVALCEHRHILGQGVYVLPAQNLAYLWPVYGGCTENHVTSVASRAS